MHRRSMRGALAVVVCATLTLAACSSKTPEGSSSSAAPAASSEADTAAETPAETGESSAAESEEATGESSAEEAPSDGSLSIQPLIQVDGEGVEVESEAGGDATDPAGDGAAKCEGVSIAMAGALTGPNAALGLNILYGAQVALDKHNKANPDCQVEIKQFDTEGDPQKATQVAPQIVGDESVVGLLGPAFSGETGATEPVFFQSGLLSLTASATRVDLTENGWTNFFRGLANDGTQGPALANYVKNTMKATKVCLVQDNSDYGVGLAEALSGVLGDLADPSCAAEIKTGDKEFSAAISGISAAAPDAVVYAGYYAEAAPFVGQLRDSGVTATFVSADGVNDPQFVEQAGDAAKGSILSCPCGPAPEEFAAEYEALNGQAPGVYSVEGYDLMTIMLTGIDAGNQDRASLLEFVKTYDAPGLARNYKWDEKGELSSALIWIYEVK